MVTGNQFFFRILLNYHFFSDDLFACLQLHNIYAACITGDIQFFKNRTCLIFNRFRVKDFPFIEVIESSAEPDLTPLMPISTFHGRVGLDDKSGLCRTLSGNTGAYIEHHVFDTINTSAARRFRSSQEL